MYNPQIIWSDFWNLEDKIPILNKDHPEYKILYGGTNYEPDASIGISCFLEPCRENFKDGFKILDYGCGAGIVLNFISLRLNNFYYVGLEPENEHGAERIKLARRLLTDIRGNFNFINEENLKKNSEIEFDCITLISIFTHLIIEDTYSTLDKLLPFLKNKKTKIIFSCFIDKEYKLLHPQPNINKNFFGVVKLTEEQLQSYATKNNLKLRRVCDFMAAGNHCHNIYTLEAYNE